MIVDMNGYCCHYLAMRFIYLWGWCWWLIHLIVYFQPISLTYRIINIVSQTKCLHMYMEICSRNNFKFALIMSVWYSVKCNIFQKVFSLLDISRWRQPNDVWYKCAGNLICLILVGFCKKKRLPLKIESALWFILWYTASVVMWDIYYYCAGVQT